MIVIFRRIKVYFVVVALWCASLGSGQVGRNLGIGNFPTKSEHNKIVSHRAAVEELINCISAVDYDERKCYSTVEKTHDSVLGFFTGEQDCRPPLCTRAEGDLVTQLVKGFSTKHPDLYKKLIDEIVKHQ